MIGFGLGLEDPVSKVGLKLSIDNAQSNLPKLGKSSGIFASACKGSIRSLLARLVQICKEYVELQIPKMKISMA